jgi:D-serine ammonia-lyase
VLLIDQPQAKDAGVSFRAHVKTHKTTQLTRLQVGTEAKDVRLVVSTLVEAEQLVPTVIEYRSRGGDVNVLYGVPLGPSQSERLGAVGKRLGHGSVAVMIDDVGQLGALKVVQKVAGFPPAVFVKIDTGYHRAGLAPRSETLKVLLEEIEAAEHKGSLVFKGYYSHASDSYGNSTSEEAMARLIEDVMLCTEVGRTSPASLRNGRKSIISVGASPTAVSIQNLQTGSVEATIATRWKELVETEQSQFEIEIHSGVYMLLDLQQVATDARHFEGDPHDSVALTILAEVRSLYADREPPEALIAAGVLALGREPCKSYSGWGVLTPYGFEESQLENDRLIVQRLSQEHGIVSFEKSTHDRALPLHVGQKIRIWPNHACIAGAGYDWYFIVDSSSEFPEKVIDIWIWWRGW